MTTTNLSLRDLRDRLHGARRICSMIARWSAEGRFLSQVERDTLSAFAPIILACRDAIRARLQDLRRNA